MNVVGYIRVSTEEQATSGAGLDAQRAALAAAAAERGWTFAQVYEDAGVSGKSLHGRTGLLEALEAIQAGDVLVVAKLDRLSRSLLDFAGLMERARREKWAVVALDLGVDTTTPAGEMLANVLASFAQFERRLIGERTKAAMAIRRAQGQHLGRPRDIDPDVLVRMRSLRSSGWSYGSIAKHFTQQGIATSRGGARWYASTIRGALTAR